jgi:hypothetical protein
MTLLVYQKGRVGRNPHNNQGLALDIEMRQRQSKFKNKKTTEATEFHGENHNIFKTLCYSVVKILFAFKFKIINEAMQMVYRK